MRAYLATLSPKIRMLLAVPALVIAYTLVTCVLPAVVRAVVPDAVRSVLSLL
jgi:ABC-type sulfate transport system permease subunit